MGKRELLSGLKTSKQRSSLDPALLGKRRRLHLAVKPHERLVGFTPCHQCMSDLTWTQTRILSAESRRQNLIRQVGGTAETALQASVDQVARQPVSARRAACHENPGGREQALARLSLRGHLGGLQRRSRA